MHKKCTLVQVMGNTIWSGLWSQFGDLGPIIVIARRIMVLCGDWLVAVYLCLLIKWHFSLYLHMAILFVYVHTSIRPFVCKMRYWHWKNVYSLWTVSNFVQRKKNSCFIPKTVPHLSTDCVRYSLKYFNRAILHYPANIGIVIPILLLLHLWPACSSLRVCSAMFRNPIEMNKESCTCASISLFSASGSYQATSRLQMRK